jgi:hypothetical protein
VVDDHELPGLARPARRPEFIGPAQHVGGRRTPQVFVVERNSAHDISPSPTSPGGLYPRCGGVIRLESRNEAYHDLRYPARRAQIQGVIRQIVRRLS